MFQQSLVEDRHVEPLADAALSVLERVGILCQSDELLDALAAAGARVDRSAQRVWFPRGVMEGFVDGLRSEHAPQGDSGLRHFSAPALPRLTLQVAQYFYDDDDGVKRLGSCADFTTCIKLGDALHGEHGVGHCLLCADAPPALEPLQAALLLAEYARRPFWVYPWDVRQIPYLQEMGEIIGVGDLWVWVAICFAHPLRFDRAVADRFVAMARAGQPMGLVAMPVAGVTTPVTAEGFIAVSAAEHVATWFSARALNPDVALAGSQWAGTVDMRTGAVSYSAPDAMYHAFSSIEFLRRWTGVSIPPGTGEYCDARAPGVCAALEKMHKAMSVAAFCGHHPEVGQGMLECGKVLSLAQLVLERDLSAALFQYDRTLDPSPENLALETVEEVGLGMQSNYLESRHTLEHFRQCLWLPQIVDRSGWRGAADDAATMARARARVRDLLDQYRKPEGREDQLAAMRKVMDRARHDLCT